MGETVHYKQLGDGGDRENKAESEWSKGVWLGPAERNTETLIGTSKGVVRAHTVERLSPSTKWDINYILDMRGTPQRPDPSKPGLHIPVRIRMEPDVSVQMPSSRSQISVPVERRFQKVWIHRGVRRLQSEVGRHGTAAAQQQM